MNSKPFILTAASLGILLGLSACGGGSTSPDSTLLPASVTSGPITAFGSIYVNGEEIETDRAKVYIEGKPASESDLRVGMMVDVLKSTDGAAMEIRFADDAEAVVIENNIPAGETTGTLNVMGFTVSVDVDTVFDSKVADITDVSLIAKGNVIEVSGYSTGKGEVTATRIEVIAADQAEYLAAHSDGMEVKGMVSNHDPAAMTFDIGSLAVNYSGAVLDDLPDGISNDLFVEVKSIEGLNSDNQLVASKVEQESRGYEGDHGDEGDEYETSGKVVAVSDSSITVNDEEILISEDTEFDDDSVNSIEIGMMVKVEARYNSDEQLVAKAIEVKTSKSSIGTELKGVIASITVEDTNIGTVILEDDSVIHISNDTIMKDESMDNDYHFNLADLSQGDYIEAYVYRNDDDSYTARKLERDDDNEMGDGDMDNPDGQNDNNSRDKDNS